MSIYHEINAENLVWSAGTVTLNGKAVGLVCPSALEGVDNLTDQKIISGPSGMAHIPSEDQSAVIKALIDTSSIVFGEHDEVVSCRELLDDPVSSRTVAYLCTVSRNCKQILENWHRIQNSKVLILGCGGIGSLCAMNLAGAGVGSLKLVDHDSIELSNLNRQFFWTRQDIGCKKVHVLARELEKRYPSAQVEILDAAFDESVLKAFIESYDLVILTADEPLGVGDQYLTDLANRDVIKLITAGYFHSYLKVSYVVGKSSPSSITCLDWKRNPWFIGPSFGPTNTELAGQVSSLAFHALAFAETPKLKASFVSHWSAEVFPRDYRNYSNEAA